MEDKKAVPPLTFMAACRAYFGQKPGQGAMDFGKEVQAMSPQDRQEITNLLEKEGFVIIGSKEGS
jgi:hypothetical protein